MAEVDRDDVTYVGRAVRPGGQRSQQAVNSAMRRGAPIDTSKKWAAGHNKQHVMDKNTAALDRETEELKHDKVTLDVARLIQQGRQAKGMSQKELATKICEKPQIITEYETGKAIPSQQILSKIERAIGIKLRGKEKGQPMPVIVPSTSTTKK